MDMQRDAKNDAKQPLAEFNRIRTGKSAENNDSYEEGNLAYPRVYGNQLICFIADDW